MRTTIVKHTCDFCDKSQDEVLMIVSGPGDVDICDECVDLCTAIVSTRRAEDKGTT